MYVTKLFEMCTKIVAISLYSNEIDIGRPFSSKILQITLGLVYNALNNKTNTTPNTQFQNQHHTKHQIFYDKQL